MTVGVIEADAINTLIEHLSGQSAYDRSPSWEAPDSAQALQALARLATSAHQRRGVGFNEESALRALNARWPGALREVWMVEMHGAEPEPFATEQLARHHVLTEGGWDPGSDLAWRTGKTDEDGRSAKILYCDGHHTLCCIWPARVRFSPPDGTAPAEARDEQARACKVCGCTEDEPCEGGCAWVVDGSLEIDLCTACAWSIVRDAIASGLYQLQPTDGDTIFEARGGLIPQPVLTEQEIDALQPLIAEVEAARGHRAKLEEIAERERTSAIAAANDALTKLMDHVAIPTHMVIDDTHVIAEELDQRDRAKAVDDATSQHKLDEAAARVTAFLDVRDASLDATLPPGLSHMRIGPGVITSWHDGERDHLLTADDLRAILAGRIRLAGEVEQLQVELGYALAPDEDDEPLTLRDVDPDAVYATEDDDYDDERAEAYQTGQDGDR